VVGDVREVVEHLIAGPADGGLDGEGIHDGRGVYAARGRERGPGALRGRPVAEPDGVAALEVGDRQGPLGCSAAAGAAELAHDRLSRVDVDPLADERCPPAVGAAIAARRERADALAQELALEVWL
jgi:hypothetical protein